MCQVRNQIKHNHVSLLFGWLALALNTFNITKGFIEYKQIIMFTYKYLFTKKGQMYLIERKNERGTCDFSDKMQMIQSMMLIDELMCKKFFKGRISSDLFPFHDAVKQRNWQW